MKRLFLASSLLLSLLGSAACGGGSGGGAIAVNDLEDELSAEICAQAVQCGGFPDVASCIEAIGFDLGQLIADVEAGLVEYDGDKARQCLDSLTSGDCSLFGGGFGDRANEEACDATFVGTVAEGGSCFSDEACAGDADCDGQDQDQCSAGTCVPSEEPPLAGEGQSCAEADCEAGLRCNGEDICAAPKALGEACDGLDECADGLICEPGPDFTTGECVVHPGTGDTCDPEFGGSPFGALVACRFIHDFCDPTDNTCKARLEPGESCAGDLENGCANYAECIDGSCVAKPGLGETCEVDGELECLGDLECVDGTCQGDPADPVCTL